MQIHNTFISDTKIRGIVNEFQQVYKYDPNRFDPILDK